MSISGIGVSWTEGDDRRLCAECGDFYEGRCHCTSRAPYVPPGPERVAALKAAICAWAKRNKRKGAR